MDPMMDNETLLRTDIPIIIQNACKEKYKVDVTIDNNIIKINMTPPKKKKKHHGSSESDEEDERPRQKRPRYAEIEGFTYQCSYKGHKKYSCNDCGEHHIDSRSIKNHVCV